MFFELDNCRLPFEECTEKRENVRLRKLSSSTESAPKTLKHVYTSHPLQKRESVSNEETSKNLFSVNSQKRIIQQYNYQDRERCLVIKQVLDRNRTILWSTLKLNWNQSDLIWLLGMLSLLKRVQNYISAWWIGAQISTAAQKGQVLGWSLDIAIFF